jgi:flagellar biogenesis protein FliO
VFIAAVLFVLWVLSRIGRRVDRLAEQTRELAEHAERQFMPRQPPQTQG